MSQKIVFMGTPEFSVPALESLVNSHHKVLAVYSQPANKANRGQKIIPSSIEIFAKEKSLTLNKSLLILSSTLQSLPAYLAEKTPGSPFKQSTSSPESSAIQGKPILS